MSESEPSLPGFNLTQLAALRQSDCGIAEERQIHISKIERMFDLKLEDLEHIDVRPMRPHALDQANPKRIVTPRGIADAENQHTRALAQSRTRRSSVAPSVPSSSSMSGI